MKGLFFAYAAHPIPPTYLSSQVTMARTERMKNLERCITGPGLEITHHFCPYLSGQKQIQLQGSLGNAEEQEASW